MDSNNLVLSPPHPTNPNTLAQFLRLSNCLNACSDAELQSQVKQLVAAAPEQLVHSVRLVLHSAGYLQEKLGTAGPNTPPVAAEAAEPASSLLSSREREVLALLARGYTLPKIGEKLFISPATVNNHCARMREKLGLGGRNALISYAATAGINPPA